MKEKNKNWTAKQIQMYYDDIVSKLMKQKSENRVTMYRKLIKYKMVLFIPISTINNVHQPNKLYYHSIIFLLSLFI